MVTDSTFNSSLRSQNPKNLAVGVVETNERGYLRCQLIDLGIAYINFNPTLENPKTEEELKLEERSWQKKQKKKYRIWNIVIAILSAGIGFILGKIGQIAIIDLGY